MIKSTFSVIKHYDPISQIFEFGTDDFDISFEGTRIYALSGITYQEIIGRVLLCWTETVKHHYIVLKNGHMYAIPPCKINGALTHYQFARRVDNLDDLYLMIDL